jgi:hypothetical protein
MFYFKPATKKSGFVLIRIQKTKLSAVPDSSANNDVAKKRRLFFEKSKDD